MIDAAPALGASRGMAAGPGAFAARRPEILSLGSKILFSSRLVKVNGGSSFSFYF